MVSFAFIKGIGIQSRWSSYTDYLLDTRRDAASRVMLINIPRLIHQTKSMTNRISVHAGLALVVLLSAAGPAAAQHFTLGADVVSRYVWRGTDYGESASVQPLLSFASGGFEVGTWASYAMNPESALANEHDIWASYTAGPVTFGVTDYYFPNVSPDFFDFDGNGDGAHSIEAFASVAGPASLPLTFFAGYFAHNDPDGSVYLNLSYPLSVDGVDLAVGIGASAVESALYGTDGFGIVEINLAASKSIPLTEGFALPLSVAYILNPYAERSFLVLGVSF